MTEQDDPSSDESSDSKQSESKAPKKSTGRLALNEAIEAYESLIEETRSELVDLKRERGELAAQAAYLSSLRTNLTNLKENLEEESSKLGEGVDECVAKIESSVDRAKEQESWLSDTFRVEFDAKIADIENDHEATQNEGKGYLQAFASLSEQLQDSINGIKQTEEKSVAVLEDAGDARDKIEEARDKIYSLLPAATSAGLASSFRTRKEALQGEQGKRSVVWNWGAGALVVLVAGTMLAGSKIGLTVEGDTWASLAKTVFLRLSILAVPVWMMLYLQLRRSRIDRLEEIYAHKEALSVAFLGYRRELQGSDGDVSRKFDENTVMGITASPAQLIGDSEEKDPTPFGPIEKLLEKTKSLFQASEKRAEEAAERAEDLLDRLVEDEDPPLPNEEQ